MTIDVIHADSRDALATMTEASIDSCVTDPPYALVSIAKRFGADGATTAKMGAYKRVSAGFMGKKWDTGDTAFDPEFWRLVLRVMKPGAHLVAFGGTRTYHRLVCAIEDAGFEIRDQLAWIFSQGFPKNHALRNVEGLLCSCKGNTIPHDQSTPQHDLRSVRRSDLPARIDAQDQRGEILFPFMPEQGASADGAAQVFAGDDGAEQSRLGGRLLHRTGQGLSPDPSPAASEGAAERLRAGTHLGRGEDAGPSPDRDGGSPPHQRQARGQPAGEPEGLPGPQVALDGGSLRNRHACPRCGKLSQAFEGFGSALKPAHEPIVLARKPLIGTVAANVLKHGSGAINIDGCRIAAEGGSPSIERRASAAMGRHNGEGRFRSGTDRTAGLEIFQADRPGEAPGRWPANLILSFPSDEYLLRPDVTREQKVELYRWMSENT